MIDQELRLQQENLAFAWQFQQIGDDWNKLDHLRWKKLDNYFSTEEKRLALFHGKGMDTALVAVIHPNYWQYFLLENFAELMEQPENRGILQIWLNNGMYEHRRAVGCAEDGMLEFELALYTV